MSWLLVCLSVCIVRSPWQGNTPETFDKARARGIEALLAGRLDEGIEAFEECIQLRPSDWGAAYNLACALSRKGEIDAALDWLKRSIEWGAIQDGCQLVWVWLEDSDLEPMRADPRFTRMLEEVQARMEAAETLPPSYIDWTRGHRVGVGSPKFSPDGSKILSTSGEARVWDSATGESLLLLRHDGLRYAAWGDGGRTILTGGHDAALRVWDARTGDPLRAYLGPCVNEGASLSPDGRLFVALAGASLCLFDTESSRRRGLRDPTTVFYRVDFSPDGARFATACADGTTRLFEAGSLGCLVTQQCGSPVFDVAFSPDGRSLVTAGADGMLRWLDVRTLDITRELRAHRAEVNDVVFRPDGQELLTASVDRTAKVWNASDGALRLTLSGHANEVTSVSYHANGERILTASGGTVRAWDARDGRLLLTLGGRGPIRRTVAFAPHGRLLSFDDRAIREWDPTSGSEQGWRVGTIVRFLRGRGDVPFEIPLRSVDTPGAPGIIELEGARVGVDAVFLSPDGRLVYSVDEDEHGRLWSAESGRMLRDLGLLSRDGELTSSFTPWVSACWSPDGRLLATARNADGALHVWDGSTGEEVIGFRGRGKWSAAVAFDPSGRLLAVARDDPQVDIWDIAGERVFSLSVHRWQRPSHVVFRPDGRALATGGTDGTVRLWDLENGRCLHVLRPLFPARVCSVAFSADGKRVAAATVDHRVLLWDAESGRLLGTIVPGDEPGDWLAFAPSGHYQGTSTSIAQTRLVQGAISYPLTCFAAALESLEKVRASLAGVQVELPRLPTPPSLVIAEPVEHVAMVSERSFRVQAIATEGLAGIARVEVVQDGTSAPADVLAGALTLEDNERLARLDMRLPIPARVDETHVTLQAVSTRGIKSRPESFVVRYEPPKRELYVLALGVADYADEQLDLAYPAQDVDGLVQRLQGQGEIFHAVHVERRVDREVTNPEVLRLREEFLLQAKPDDTLIVFVAGHGIRTDTGEYWFLTSDATPAKPFGGIQRSTLESLVTWDKLHATKRVLLLDTCHSGAAFGKGSRGERGIAFQQSEVDTLLERSSGLYILAATSDEGFAREQAGNGLFTRALLDGLDGAADTGDFGDKDGTVGIDELMHFARYAVLERSAGRQQPTFPKIEGGENFPLARARAREGAGR